MVVGNENYDWEELEKVINFILVVAVAKSVEDMSQANCSNYCRGPAS